MTNLKSELMARIALQGPLTVADFTTECLLHPKFGYYTTRDPFGQAGDFVTAPEISQMFGELLGLCLAQAWQDQGGTSPFALVELGPGRGTLMADMLRATRRIAGFHNALKVHLIEVSPTLKKQQAKRLANYHPVWHPSLDTLPALPLFLVANEFFDALPIRQFVRDGMGWRERCILTREGALEFGLTASTPHAALAHRIADTTSGDLVETCAPGAAIAQQIGQRLIMDGGAAIIIDYGEWRSLGDTLQAIQAHQSVPPLRAPGTADITAHVDFETLATASPSAHTRLTSQGVFLERLGITERAQQLAKKMQEPALTSHIAAHRRLLHPDEMGELFKVIGLLSSNAPPLPGLDA